MDLSEDGDAAMPLFSDTGLPEISDQKNPEHPYCPYEPMLIQVEPGKPFQYQVPQYHSLPKTQPPPVVDIPLHIGHILTKEHLPLSPEGSQCVSWTELHHWEHGCPHNICSRLWYFYWRYHPEPSIHHWHQLTEAQRSSWFVYYSKVLS